MNEQEQRAYTAFRAQIGVNSFTTAPYVRRVEKPWGWEIHFTPDNLPYMGKILHVNAGKRLSLQSHDVKQESWYKVSGDARLIMENQSGEMEEIRLEDGVGYTCKLGQKHRLAAGDTDAEIFEVSTPEVGNTYRLEDDFARSTETEAERDKRNREATVQGE